MNSGEADAVTENLKQELASSQRKLASSEEAKRESRLDLQKAQDRLLAGGGFGGQPAAASEFSLASDPMGSRAFLVYMRQHGLHDVNDTSNGENLLHKMCGHACPPWNRWDTLGLVTELLQSGFTHSLSERCSDASTQWSGQRAIDLLCNNRGSSGIKPEILLLLHTAGLDIDAVDHLGRAPILSAAGSGNTEVVQMLIRLKAKIDVVHPNGQTLVFDK
jgi:hypothetical protein